MERTKDTDKENLARNISFRASNGYIILLLKVGRVICCGSSPTSFISVSASVFASKRIVGHLAAYKMVPRAQRATAESLEPKSFLCVWIKLSPHTHEPQALWHINPDSKPRPKRPRNGSNSKSQSESS
jgi:hypothetical protein